MRKRGVRQILEKKNAKNEMENKRALWPWDVRLRMTIYKGIGEHISSQSPAMKYDRSAVSLKLNMGYVDKINRM